MSTAQVSTLEQLIFDSESTLLGKVLQGGTTMECMEAEIGSAERLSREA